MNKLIDSGFFNEGEGDVICNIAVYIAFLKKRISCLVYIFIMCIKPVDGSTSVSGSRPVSLQILTTQLY